MMAPIVTTTEVDRPAEAVFSYATDPTRFSEWQQGVVSGHLEGDPPHRVGDHCVTTRRIGGAQRTVVSELTHIDPPRTWGVRGIDGPIRATVDVTVEQIGDGSRSSITIELDFTGHGIGRLLVPLFVAPSARREMDANISRLRERLATPSQSRRP